MAKRLFDIALSIAGLAALLPFFPVIGLLIKLDSPGPVFFRQERVGQDFRRFSIYKFRSMYTGNSGPSLTARGDKRVTRAGRILRRSKLDELPQLINVLKGEMSFVGPRPEVEKYVGLFREDYERLLKVRPGITDPASIRYSDEECILASSPDAEEDYIRHVLPEKIRLAASYAAAPRLTADVGIIVRTLLRIKGGGRA